MAADRVAAAPACCWSGSADLRMGAGWGVLDASGSAEGPVVHASPVRRPRSRCLLTDEGVERPRRARGQRHRRRRRGRAHPRAGHDPPPGRGGRVPGRGPPARERRGLGPTPFSTGFRDLALRVPFRAAGLRAGHRRPWSTTEGGRLSRAAYLPGGLSGPGVEDVGLSAELAPPGSPDDGRTPWSLTVSARDSPQFVQHRRPRFRARRLVVPSAPGEATTVDLTPEQRFDESHALRATFVLSTRSRARGSCLITETDRAHGRLCTAVQCV